MGDRKEKKKERKKEERRERWRKKKEKKKHSSAHCFVASDCQKIAFVRASAAQFSPISFPLLSPFPLRLFPPPRVHFDRSDDLLLGFFTCLLWLFVLRAYRIIKSLRHFCFFPRVPARAAAPSLVVLVRFDAIFHGGSSCCIYVAYSAVFMHESTRARGFLAILAFSRSAWRTEACVQGISCIYCIRHILRVRFRQYVTQIVRYEPANVWVFTGAA